MKSALRLGIWLTVFILLSLPAMAQTTATISGVVSDQAGAVLPGVTIIVESPSLLRGQVSVVTDDRGRYRIPGLQPGVYSLTADLPGFSTNTVTDIDVPLNSNTVQNVTLQLADLQQEVTVQADTVVIRTTESDLQEVIDEREINNLPLNGRQFLDLMALTPGVASRPPDSDQGSAVTVFGERSITNSFLVDGLDNNNNFDRNFSDFFIQDAIQEFQVLLGGYQAEFGRAQGAVTNVITRTGTNDFHGRFFYFLRNDALDSSNISGQAPEGLDRQEVGGTIGGPIWKDHTFFFDALQYLREERTNNFDLSIIPSIINNGYFTPSIGAEPFDLVPLQERYTNFFRLDHQFNQANQLFFSLNTNRATNEGSIPPALGAPPGTISLPSTASDIRQDTTSFNVRHTGFFNTSTFLESSFRFSRIAFGENDEKPEGAEQLFPITFNPFIIWATNGPLVDATTRDQDRFQFTENLSYIKSDHSFKFGVDVLRNELFNDTKPRQSIIVGNSGLEFNEAYRRIGYEISMQRANDQIVSPNDTVTASDNQLALYGQDAWQVIPGLTLNLGARYDVSTLFDDDKNNISPRAGFAWDLGKNGKTVLRASYGRFYDQILLETVVSTPELGGIQLGAFDVQTIPRGASFYNNPALGAQGPLQDSNSRFLANPLFFQYILPEGFTRQAGNCMVTGLGRPYIIYELLGIPVPDPTLPPVLNISTIPQLTGGMTPAAALTILNNFFSPANNATQLPNCGNPGGPQFDFLQVTGANSVNQGQPLIFLFRQLSPVVDNIQTIRRPTKTPYTDSFNLGIEQALGKDISLDVQLFIRRSRDLLSRRVINLLPQPISASCAGNTVDMGACNRQLEFIGFLNSNAVTVSLNKRFSQKYSFLANYTYTDAEDNFSTLRVPPPSDEVSFLFNNFPERDIGRSLNSPVHNFVASSIYELPWNFHVSGILRAASGRPFNAVGIGSDSDGDNIFDNRLIGTEKGEFLTDPFFQLDMRLAKQFNLGESIKVTGLIEFFNITNRANPFEVNRNCRDSDGNGTPDPGGCSGGDFGRVVRPFPGREIQLGFRLEF